jgi:hypothetical protein
MGLRSVVPDLGTHIRRTGWAFRGRRNVWAMRNRWGPFVERYRTFCLMVPAPNNSALTLGNSLEDLLEGPWGAV